jgi:hypothetical protein
LKPNKRWLRNLLLILIVAAVLAGGGIYLVYTGVTARGERKLRIEDLLAQADYEISLGYYEKALESLEQAQGGARGEYNTLRILKRVYQISYDLEDYSFLHDFARSAAERIPGS